VVVWEEADCICGKLLKVILPCLLESLESHGHLVLNPLVRQHLLAASAATLERLLASVRSQATNRKKRRSPPKPSLHVPIRMFADWEELLPRFLEFDFGAHGGSSAQGAFLWSLVATDLCSGRTEAVPLVAREQSFVVQVL
jgi:hypothetical protein